MHMQFQGFQLFSYYKKQSEGIATKSLCGSKLDKFYQVMFDEKAIFGSNNLILEMSIYDDKIKICLISWETNKTEYFLLNEMKMVDYVVLCKKSLKFENGDKITFYLEEHKDQFIKMIEKFKCSEIDCTELYNLIYDKQTIKKCFKLQIIKNIESFDLFT